MEFKTSNDETKDESPMRSDQMYSLLILVLFTPACLCQYGHSMVRGGDGSDDQADGARLWKGNITSYIEHPYFALVTKRRGLIDKVFDFRCGGSFITPQLVLTAAHCIHGFTVDNIRVRYGTDKASSTNGDANAFGTGIDRKVSGLYSHPKYRGRQYNFSETADIGLVRLAEPIEHSTYVLHLPQPDEDKAFIGKDYKTTIVAMGNSLDDDIGLVMKEANIRRLFTPCNYDEQGHFAVCARFEPFRVCPGDSGSPIFARTDRGRVVVAVASKTYYKCKIGQPYDGPAAALQEYVRVSAAMKWILETITKKTRCHCLTKIVRQWVLGTSLWESEF